MRRRPSAGDMLYLSGVLAIMENGGNVYRALLSERSLSDEIG